MAPCSSSRTRSTRRAPSLFPATMRWTLLAALLWAGWAPSPIVGQGTETSPLTLTLRPGYQGEVRLGLFGGIRVLDGRGDDVSSLFRVEFGDGRGGSLSLIVAVDSRAPSGRYRVERWEFRRLEGPGGSASMPVNVPVVTDQPTFTVTDLLVGLHPFRLVVTDDGGNVSAPAEAGVRVVAR
jgi:hypothetical protein